MDFKKQLISGTLIKRYKRFLVDVKIDEMEEYSKKYKISYKESVKSVLGWDLH